MKNYRRFKKYFDYSFGGVMIFDITGKYKYRNRVAANFTNNLKLNNFDEFAEIFNCKYTFIELLKRCKAEEIYTFNSKGMQINISLVEEDEVLIMNMHTIANLIDTNLSEEAADGFLVMNEELNILYANKTLCKLSGFTKDELLQKNYVDLFEKNDITKSPPKVDDITPRKSVVVEREFQKKNKELIHVEIHSKLLSNSNYFSVLRNIEIRVKFRNQIEHKNKELKKTNDKLLASEQQYRHLFKHLPIGIITAKADGTIENMNDKMKNIFGSESIEKSIQLNILDVLKSQNKEFYSDFISSVQQGVKYEKFYNYTSLWGKTTYIKTRLLPFVQDDVQKIMILIEDYTEQEKQDQLMRILSVGVANSSAAVIVTDLEGRMVFVNKQIMKLSRYREDELIGESVEKFNYTDGNNAMYNDLWKTIKSGKDWVGELRNKKKDGSKYWVSAMISPMRGKYGNITNYISIQEDITEKKAIEKELKFKTQQLIGLINNMPDGVCFKGENDEWIMANTTMLKLFGIPKNEYINKTNDELLNLCNRNQYYFPEDTEADKLAWSKKHLISFETKVINQKGENIIVEVTKLPLFHTNGDRKGMISIGRNVTEKIEYVEKLKFAKEKAEQADRLKSSFLANMSHEIRTPLNAIQGFSDVIADYDLDKKSLVKFTNIIKVNSIKLVALIEDVLFFSRLQERQIQVQESKFNVLSTFTQLKQVFDKEIEVSINSKIELKINDEAINLPIMIVTDHAKLIQIFTKLIRNAIKFTSEGAIKYGFNISKEKEVIFFVKDSGVGISTDKQKIIFEQFRQVDDSTTRKYGGTGLGLSIVKNLIDLLEGEIWIDSELEKGTTFYFKLPLKSFEIVKQTVKPDNLSVNWATKKMLIVDDVSESVLLMSESLKPSMIQIIAASDGKQAIEIVKNNTDIDVVLMDIQLPEMNGLEASKQIKNIRPNLPIIVQTAFKQSGYEDKITEFGCNDIIYKPVNFDILIPKLKKILGLSHD